MTDTVGTASGTSPEALLKQAVTGARTEANAMPAPDPVAKPSPLAKPSPSWTGRFDPRLFGVAGAALMLGGLLGAGANRLGATADDRAVTAIAEVQQRLGSAQTDTDRLNTALAEIGKRVAHMQEGVDTGRTEARTRGTAALERIARAEQALTAKLAALGERLEQIETSQAGRVAALTAQLEKRPAPSVPVAVKVAAEPTETGALPDPKAHVAPPKPPATDNWAVREVYDGIAVLEDRKRRLIEVGIGDTIPGVGRIETIERRGRTWAVITRQGVITPQTW